MSTGEHTLKAYFISPEEHKRKMCESGLVSVSARSKTPWNHDNRCEAGYIVGGQRGSGRCCSITSNEDGGSGLTRKRELTGLRFDRSAT